MKRRRRGSPKGPRAKRGRTLSKTSQTTSSKPNLTLSVSVLHDQMCQKLKNDQDALMNYLLDCQPFLKSQDTEAWIKQFGPADKHVIPCHDQDMCPQCQRMCVLDVTNNIVVCQECGLVVDTTVLLIDTGHTSYTRLKRIHRKRPHFYNPVTHFKDYVKQLTGMEHYRLLQKDEDDMRRILSGYTNITPNTVESVLRKLKLNKKYLKNCVSLAVKFGGYEPCRITGIDYYTALKMFVSLNKYWKWHKNELAPGRKSFMNYPFVFYQISKKLKREDWIQDVKLLKHKKSLDKQHEIWSRVCKHLKNQFEHFM